MDDARALTAAIRSVLESPDLRQGLIEGASRVYAEGYSRAHIVNEYVEFYRRITGR
ncbi:glycosyltransferase [Marinobacterium aestuariivivens]|uniref:Glycosyltransferase n=1 Tax=Marinobacterium aestuariivivens TaxID=1698799 RepID=A0ABW1ZYP2_9GAMM